MKEMKKLIREKNYSVVGPTGRLKAKLVGKFRPKGGQRHFIFREEKK